VYSWFEREEARRAAWAAPGVKNVEDRIGVVHISALRFEVGLVSSPWSVRFSLQKNRG
jgi:hypothetical protein